MVSVGIMSMQRIFNYGSSLQAYGLRRLVESMSGGVDVRFVDYRPGDVLMVDGSAPSSGLGRVIAKVRQYNEVDTTLKHKLKFFEHKRSYGSKYFPLVGVPARPSRDLDLDVQIIGSDEVFNCVQSNAHVGYSRDLFGHGSPARLVVSYAASFGNTTVSKLRQFGIAAELATDLGRFASLSVRDAHSASVIRELIGQDPQVHVDPVLAYDFMGVEASVPSRRMHPDKYIVVYGYSGRLTHEENLALAKHARAIGARILCFGGVQECCDEFVDCNPFELLAYFRDAEAVITDTFHGSIFSIINRVPFATILRKSGQGGYGNEEKLRHLLDSFGLSSQFLADISQLAEVLAVPIDYHEVDRKLAAERSRTTEYLSAMLGAVQG